MEYEVEIKRLFHSIEADKKYIEYVDAEIKKYSEQKRLAVQGISENKVKIIELMKENGVVSDKTDFATFTIKSSPPSVVVPDVDKLPDEFVKVKREPDKNKIKQFLADNGSCDWAEWGEYKEILMIKDNVK